MSRIHDVQVTNISISDVKHNVRDDNKVYLADFVESGTNTISSAVLGEALAYATGKQLVITPYLQSDGSRGVWQFQSKTYDLTTFKTVSIVGECAPIIELQVNTAFKIGDGFSLSNVTFNKAASLEKGFIMSEGTTAHFNNVSVVATSSATNVVYGISLTNSGNVYLKDCFNLYGVNTATDDVTTLPNCNAYYTNCFIDSVSTHIGQGCTNYMYGCRFYNKYYYGKIYAIGCFMNDVYGFIGGANSTLFAMHLISCDITGLGTVNLGDKANVTLVGCNFAHGGTPAFTIGSTSAVLLEGCKVGCASSLLTSLTGVTLGHCMFLDGVYPKTS